MKTGKLECERCRSELIEASENGRRGTSQRASFEAQLKPIRDKLKLTEGIEIP